MTTYAPASDTTATLGRVLTRLRADGLRRDADEIPALENALDDLERVLDEYTDLSHSVIRELEASFRVTFRRWITMSEIIGVRLDTDTSRRAYAVLAETPPPDYLSALGHLRRVALVVQDLIERCVRSGGP